MITGIGIPTATTERRAWGLALLLLAPYRLTLFFGQVAHCVLGVPDHVAHLAFGTIGCAFGLKVAIAGHLPGLLLDRAGRLLQTALDPLFIHNRSPKLPTHD